MSCKHALGVFILLACLSNIFWIHSNAAPRVWEDAFYLVESVDLYHTLQAQGLSAFLRKCIDFPPTLFSASWARSF